MHGNTAAAADIRPGRKTAFLHALVDTVNVARACRDAGIPRRTAYDWRDADPDFAREWDDALDDGIDLLEAELHRRAFEGVEKPIYYKGERVGTTRHYSDALAMFLLKAHRPARYRDNYRPPEPEPEPDDPASRSRKLREAVMRRLDEEAAAKAEAEAEEEMEEEEEIEDEEEEEAGGRSIFEEEEEEMEEADGRSIFEEEEEEMEETGGRSIFEEEEEEMEEAGERSIFEEEEEEMEETGGRTFEESTAEHMTRNIPISRILRAGTEGGHLPDSWNPWEDPWEDDT